MYELPNEPKCHLYFSISLVRSAKSRSCLRSFFVIPSRTFLLPCSISPVVPKADDHTTRSNILPYVPNVREMADENFLNSVRPHHHSPVCRWPLRVRPPTRAAAVVCPARLHGMGWCLKTTNLVGVAVETVPFPRFRPQMGVAAIAGGPTLRCCCAARRRRRPTRRYCIRCWTRSTRTKTKTRPAGKSRGEVLLGLNGAKESSMATRTHPP